MAQMALRSAHPDHTAEMAPRGVRLIYRLMIGMAFLLSFAPFIYYFSQH